MAGPHMKDTLLATPKKVDAPLPRPSPPAGLYKIWVPTIAQFNLSFSKFPFFPTMKSGSKSAGAGGQTPQPPASLHGGVWTWTVAHVGNPSLLARG